MHGMGKCHGEREAFEGVLLLRCDEWMTCHILPCRSGCTICMSGRGNKARTVHDAKAVENKFDFLVDVNDDNVRFCLWAASQYVSHNPRPRRSRSDFRGLEQIDIILEDHSDPLLLSCC